MSKGDDARRPLGATKDDYKKEPIVQIHVHDTISYSQQYTSPFLRLAYILRCNLGAIWHGMCVVCLIEKEKTYRM